jgi:hypothetical protein
MSFQDWVEMMGSLDPKMDGVRYFEWIGVFLSFAWMIVIGIHYHRARKGKGIKDGKPCTTSENQINAKEERESAPEHKKGRKASIIGMKKTV